MRHPARRRNSLFARRSNSMGRDIPTPGPDERPGERWRGGPMIGIATKTPGCEFAEPILVSVDQAATWLGLSTRTLFRLHQAGEIPCVRPTPGRVLFSPDDLRAFKASTSAGRRRKRAESNSPLTTTAGSHRSEPILVSVDQAAWLLSFSVRTLFRLYKAGEIPCVRPTPGRVLFSLDDLRAWAETRREWRG